MLTWVNSYKNLIQYFSLSAAMATSKKKHMGDDNKKYNLCAMATNQNQRFGQNSYGW